MSREKKSQVDDITKLRRILDNSSDPSLKYLISKDDYALESVRRRLSGDFFETQLYTERFFRSSESLEPTVSIHTKNPITPRLVTPPPKLRPSLPLPEFELVSQSTPAPLIPSPAITFIDEELFEVEKIDRSIPEFLEVTPKNTMQESLQDNQIMHQDETSLTESKLPEWQPVEEEQAAEALETPEKPTPENVPEFERVTIAPTPGIEKPVEWESMQPKEEHIEPPVDFLPAESSDVSFQKLTKKQERAAKKAQKKQEKDEKKLKRIELKRLKKEKEEKERGAKIIKEAPQPLLEPDEEPSGEAGPLDVTKTPPIKVDYNNFRGIESIDEKTAELLYKNGYFSIENIKDAAIDEIIQIRGMKRKLAKQIKREIEGQITETATSEFIPAKQKTTKKKEKKKFQDSTEWESSASKEKTQKSSSLDVCTYKEYTLYKRETKKSDGTKSTLHYFTKNKSARGRPSGLPEGYHVALNKKTKAPYLKKK
jgi:hypothetical protein